MRILKITDNLSKTLQNDSLSAAEAQDVTKLTLKTLQKMRTDENFDLFFKVVLSLQESTGTDTPILPRKRKAPRHYEVGSEEGHHSSTVQDLYRKHYYEALDGAIATIKNRFDQPGYVMYCYLEALLTKETNQKDFTQEFDHVTGFYGADLNASSLSAQLTTLA